VKAFDCNGQWWVPEAPERRCSGALRCNDAGELTLALIGTLVDAPIGSSGDDSRIILGVVSEPPLGNVFGNQAEAKVTLANCFVTRQTMGSGLQTRQEFFAHRAFLGAHLVNEQDFNFQSIQLSLSGLSSWANGLSGFLRPASDPWTISFRYPDPVSGTFPGGKFSLGVGCTWSDSHREQRLTEFVKFSLTLTEPAPLGLQNDLVYWIQNLFTFATDHPNAITELVVQKQELLGERISVVGPRAFSDETAAENLMPWQMLFSLSDVTNRFGEIVTKWFELSKRFPEVTALYFGTQYNPPAYSDIRFQLIVQALSLYYARREQRARSTNSSDELLERIAVNLSPADVKAVQRLFDSHPLVLSERALESLTVENREAIEPLVLSKSGSGLKDFINETLNTLYYILTRNAVNLMGASDGAALYWLTERLAFLIKVSFLSEIGFTIEERRAILGRNQRFRYICDSIQPGREPMRGGAN
jgi:ApeA N-terminal domain 1